MRHVIRFAVCGLFILIGSTLRLTAESPLPEPGPESGGLRLKLAIRPHAESGKDSYEVQLDLLNVTNQPISLRTGWHGENARGDFKEFFEAAASFEAYPPIEPWMGSVVEFGPRQSPQLEQTLKPGEILSVKWRTTGRQLKNKISDPNEAQNPNLLMPGLYSIHATIIIPTGKGPVRLRSNEQFIPVGGSRQMPKHTLGTLWSVNADTQTAHLSLGSLHGIERGDQFKIGTGKIGDFWRLTVTSVQAVYSTGSLEPGPKAAANTSLKAHFPERHTDAVLIQPK